MHKLESFATSCGSKINKPFIDYAFYPIVDEKFICISQDSPYQAKSYDLFDDVIFHIKPYLDKNNISIIQIGKKESGDLFYTKNYKNLSFKQNSYIVNKSILYLGNLNVYSHLAYSIGKTIICPSNHDYLETSKPYWINNESLIALPGIDHKPFFSKTETPKTINKINPEILACHILDTLNIKHDLNLIETLHIGADYTNKSIDIVPFNCNSQTINVDPNIYPNIRLDKNFTPSFLTSFYKYKNIVITTDKEIKLDFLYPIKNSIKCFNFIVDSNTSEDSVLNLSKLGKPIYLFTKEEDSLPEIRLKFFDFTVMSIKEYSKSSLSIDFINDSIKFLSKKNILSEKGVFNSYYSLDVNSNSSSVTDSQLFWDDLNHYRIYKINS